MTISTKARAISGFARFAGLAAIIGLFAVQATVLASQVTAIGTDLHSDTKAPEPDTAADNVHEAADVHGTPDAPHRLLIPQTETKRKPALFIPVVQQAVDDPIQSAIKLPREPRFLKDDPVKSDTENGVSEKFHWKPAILQSVLIQGFQLSYALVVQEKTRRALKGPFFDDYWKSIKGVRGWSDGNKFFTNYIAHPMQGGMTGFIFVQNHDRAKKQKFGESKQYWKDRFKAFVWSAAWSTNWELGPISQSSVGNVGLYKKQGYVDLVITPTVGTGWLVTEEALDRYVIRHLETRGPKVKKLVRTFLNPMRAVANLLRFKEPWYRDRPYGH
jgi:hypothetical protein